MSSLPFQKNSAARCGWVRDLRPSYPYALKDLKSLSSHFNSRYSISLIKKISMELKNITPLSNFHWKWTRKVKVGYRVLMELCCWLDLGWGKWRSSNIHSTSLVDKGRRAWEITIITMFLLFKETRRIFWTHKKKSIQFWRSSSKGVISVSWLYCLCRLCYLVNFLRSLVNWDYLLHVMTFEAVPCSGVYVVQRTECDCWQEATGLLPCCRLVGMVERWNIYGQKITILFHFSHPLECKSKN